MKFKINWSQYSRTKSKESRLFPSIVKQFNKAKTSKIHMANLIIVLCSLIVTVAFIIVGYIFLAINWGDTSNLDGAITGNNNVHGPIWTIDGELNVASWIYIFVVPLCGIAAYAGIVAVIASNNKSPVKFFILSSITVLYRIGFVLTQMLTQPENGGGVNATLLLGQPAFFLMLIAQCYLWIRWNNQGVDGKFQSEALKGKRAMLAWIIVSIITVFLIFFSFLFNKDAGLVAIFMDVIPSAAYMIGAILNAFGNILCFPFFIVGNLGWFYWGIKGIVENEEPLMTLMAISTMLQALGLNALLVTGFCQWFKEDFTWVKGKGIKQKTTEQKLFVQGLDNSKNIDEISKVEINNKSQSK